MPVDIRHMAPLLQVFDMPTAIHFYRDVLGFEVVNTSRPGDHFDWALLRFNGVELMLNTAYEEDERPAAPDPARVAAHRDTALYFGCKDLEGAYRHLREHGLKVKGQAVALRHEAVVCQRPRRLRPLLSVACQPALARNRR